MDSAQCELAHPRQGLCSPLPASQQPREEGSWQHRGHTALWSSHAHTQDVWVRVPAFLPLHAAACTGSIRRVGRAHRVGTEHGTRTEEAAEGKAASQRLPESQRDQHTGPREA